MLRQTSRGMSDHNRKDHRRSLSILRDAPAGKRPSGVSQAALDAWYRSRVEATDREAWGRRPVRAAATNPEKPWRGTEKTSTRGENTNIARRRHAASESERRVEGLCPSRTLGIREHLKQVERGSREGAALVAKSGFNSARTARPTGEAGRGSSGDSAQSQSRISIGNRPLRIIASEAETPRVESEPAQAQARKRVDQGVKAVQTAQMQCTGGWQTRSVFSDEGERCSDPKTLKGNKTS
jgi:hypothetical protein